MKAILIVLFIAFLFAGCCEKEETVRIMTFNIRMNTPSDSANAWPFRKDMAAGMIRFHKADLAGLQEALPEQIADLEQRLPEYDWFGVGRDDGVNQGEYSCVFYRKERFRIMDGNTFWLSETPEKPGMGWDAACPRIVTWMKIRDIKTDKIFYHFNTHFDHRGKRARKESAILLLEKAATLALKEPVVVTGDFNCTFESPPYKILTGEGEGYSGEKLIDSKTVSVSGHHGPSTTWSGFKSAYWPDSPAIDHIFVSEGITVLSHGTLSDTFNGRFPSDHLPVIADIILK
jgi:endonuclease/exonuclease/phosphatase family metal-dependent hydrolase